MKHMDEFITEEELGRLVMHAKRERDAALVTFLFYSVRRVSEIVRSLRVRDISLKSDNIEYTILKKAKKCAACGRRIRKSDGVFVCFQKDRNVWEYQGEGHVPSEKKVRVWIREGPLFPGCFDNYSFIRKYIESRHMKDDDFVFPICRDMADKIVKEMALKAGIVFRTRKMHMHVLRHSGAVYYAKRCRNMMDLMRLNNKLQHSTIDMTGYYLNHFKEDEA